MKTLLAWEDLVSASTTTLSCITGQAEVQNLRIDNALTDDLTQPYALDMYSGASGETTVIVRADLGKPTPVATVAALNVFAPTPPAQPYTSGTALPLTVRLRDTGLASLASSSTFVSMYPAAPRNRDSYFFFNAQPVARYIDWEFGGRVGSAYGFGVLCFIGRLFASSGMVLTDSAEVGWSLEFVDTGRATRVLGGGVRPAPGGRSRVVNVTLSGLSQTEAYGATAYNTTSVRGIQDLQCVAGVSKPLLIMVRADSAQLVYPDITDFSVFGPLAQVPRIERDAQSDATYHTALQVIEASR